MEHDREYARELARRIGHLGGMVQTALSPESALKSAQAHPPDAAIIQVDLPHASGLDLIKKLKEINPLVLCLMLTGSAETETAIQALQLGAHDYLSKPLGFKTIESRLKRCQERVQRWRREDAALYALNKRNLNLEQVNERLREIIESSKGAAAPARLKKAAPRLIRELGQDMGAARGQLVFCEGKELLTAGGLGGSNKKPPDWLSCLLWEALEAGPPRLASGPLEDAEAKLAGSSAGPTSCMILPLSDGRGKTIGLAWLAAGQGNVFNEQDLALGAALGRCVSEALKITQTVEALKESQERYRILVENIDLGISLVNTQHEILMTNAGQNRIIGYQGDMVLGRKCYQVFRGQDCPCPGCPGSLAMASGMRQEAEMTLPSPVKGERQAMVRAFPTRDTEGAVSGFILVVEDITTSKKAARENEELTDKLNRARRVEAIGKLAGGVAHDFNNILGAMIGFTELALGNIEDKQKAASSLQKVLQTGLRAKALVNQILTFSRLDQLELKPVDMGAVAREATEMSRASLPKGIKLNLKIQAENSLVQGDPAQLGQVITNLLTNALAALEGQGEINIGLEEIRLDTTLNTNTAELPVGDYLRLTVRDNGCGIPEAAQKRVFEPYFTAHESNPGAGLGLSVAHGIISNHQGGIALASQPGRGACFHVYLPRLRGAEPQPEPEKNVAVSGRGRILFVDDEKSLVEVMDEMLTQLGYQVTALTSSPSALEIFSKTPYDFDLVITDQSMPAMTGVELARQILAIRPGMPIILCTGYSEQIDQAKARRLGLGGLILKPVNISEFSRVIHHALKPGAAS